MDQHTIGQLIDALGEAKVTTGKTDLMAYSYDATFHRGMPDVVVFPESADDVSQVMRIASASQVAVTARGAGTGLSGGSLPMGGIALVLSRMNRILEIDKNNALAVVEAGVVTGNLHRAVEAEGLFYPPDPSSARACTIGGNIAENAGGPRGFKYGVTGNYVLGLQVVLADGRILRTGGRTRKNVTGFNLTSLFLGSEGSLGIVTEATLKLIPKPEAFVTLSAEYDDLLAAGNAIAAVVKSGIVPSALEIMDKATIGCVEEYLHMGLPVDAEAVLIVELDGHPEVVERQLRDVERICRKTGAGNLAAARDDAKRAALWKARKSISPAVARLGPTKISEDATVPASQVPKLIQKIGEIRRKYDVNLVVFGHAGDGNLHPNILTDERDEEEMARVKDAMGEIFQAALDLGGTLTGEHGIGTVKAPYLEWELQEVGMDVTRRLKKALDPQGILNPGKMGL